MDRDGDCAVNGMGNDNEHDNDKGDGHDNGHANDIDIEYDNDTNNDSNLIPTLRATIMTALPA